MHLGEEVEEGVRRRRDAAEMAMSAAFGDRVYLRGEAGGERGDGERVHGQQSLGGGRRTADRQVRRRRRGVAWRQAAPVRGDTEGDRVVRRLGKRVPGGRRPG